MGMFLSLRSPAGLRQQYPLTRCWTIQFLQLKKCVHHHFSKLWVGTELCLKELFLSFQHKPRAGATAKMVGSAGLLTMVQGGGGPTASRISQKAVAAVSNSSVVLQCSQEHAHCSAVDSIHQKWIRFLLAAYLTESEGFLAVHADRSIIRAEK